MAVLNADYSNLNYDEMAAAIGLNAKHMPMLIGSFMEESTSIMDSLGEAISNKDFTGIRSHAHSIKGSAGNLKFNEIYEMSREMELAASDNNEEFEYETYFEAIKTAMATIKL